MVIASFNKYCSYRFLSFDVWCSWLTLIIYCSHIDSRFHGFLTFGLTFTQYISHMVTFSWYFIQISCYVPAHIELEKIKRSFPKWCT
ncbi:hypothetical protein EB796_007689 [Bugula neritina]|uniref:Uncharacterized protein n=1 Tax=Bugula neritina TaxID=10212 RepID=A0A7J7K726_BUGNE|nr:hypothetical protein EB796_007689 [Bugula neritina]